MAKKKARRVATKAKVTQKPAKRAAAKPLDAADAIRQLDAEFMTAANAKDASALVKAFYAQDAVLMPPNHAIVEGRGQIQNFLQGLITAGFSGGRSSVLSPEGSSPRHSPPRHSRQGSWCGSGYWTTPSLTPPVR